MLFSMAPHLPTRSENNTRTRTYLCSSGSSFLLLCNCEVCLRRGEQLLRFVDFLFVSLHRVHQGVPIAVVLVDNVLSQRHVLVRVLQRKKMLKKQKMRSYSHTSKVPKGIPLHQKNLRIFHEWQYQAVFSHVIKMLPNFLERKRVAKYTSKMCQKNTFSINTPM